MVMQCADEGFQLHSEEAQLGTLPYVDLRGKN